MGTLFNQKTGNYHQLDEKDIVNFLNEVKEIAKKLKLTEDQVLAA